MAITQDPDSVAKICSCCGKTAIGLYRSWVFKERPLIGRCKAHLLSNPCVVEGCRRSTAKFQYRTETGFICSDHWRLLCPPRSQLRATYNRFFRLARKSGADANNQRWPDALENRFWRFWFALVKRAQRGQQEAIDERAINEMFGWVE